MKRRAFLAGVGSAVAWPMVARGQQPALPVVGFLSGRSCGESPIRYGGFPAWLERKRLHGEPKRRCGISLG